MLKGGGVQSATGGGGGQLILSNVLPARMSSLLECPPYPGVRVATRLIHGLGFYRRLCSPLSGPGGSLGLHRATLPHRLPIKFIYPNPLLRRSLSSGAACLASGAKGGLGVRCRLVLVQIIIHKMYIICTFVRQGSCSRLIFAGKSQIKNKGFVKRLYCHVARVLPKMSLEK